MQFLRFNTLPPFKKKKKNEEAEIYFKSPSMYEVPITMNSCKWFSKLGQELFGHSQEDSVSNCKHKYFTLVTSSQFLFL